MAQPQETNLASRSTVLPLWVDSGHLISRGSKQSEPGLLPQGWLLARQCKVLAQRLQTGHPQADSGPHTCFNIAQPSNKCVIKKLEGFPWEPRFPDFKKKKERCGNTGPWFGQLRQ